MISLSFSRREKYIFTSTIIIIASALFYNFLLEPIFKEWNDLNRGIVIKKTRLRKAIKLLENRNTIIQNYNTYAASIRNLPKILGYIEKKALSLGLTLSNIRPRPVVTKGLHKEYTIEVQIEGDPSAINKFISQLIKAPIFITLKKFDLRTLKEDPSRYKGTLILSKIII